MSFSKQLIDTANLLGYSASQIRLITNQALPVLTRKCERQFQDLQQFTWWPEPNHRRNHLAPTSSVHFSNGNAYQEIPNLVDSGEDNIWFIAENWPASDSVGYDALVAFEAKPECVFGLLENMHAFEYMLVSRTFEWLIAENHHGFLIAYGSEMATKLKQLAT